MYNIVDTHTRKVIASYKARNRAQNRADKLDMEYGAVRYIVRIANTSLLTGDSVMKVLVMEDRANA